MALDLHIQFLYIIKIESQTSCLLDRDADVRRLGEYHGDERIWQAFNRPKPDDWTDLQVEHARRGMAISHAGVGSHVTATILMDPDHLIRKDG